MVVVEKRLAIGLTEGPWPGPLKYHKRSGEVSPRDAVGAAHTKGTRKLVQAEHRPAAPSVLPLLRAERSTHSGKGSIKLGTQGRRGHNPRASDHRSSPSTLNPL